MLRACKQTLTNPVVFEGIGLHSGKRSKVTILPEQEANGIVFKRIDLKDKPTVRALFKNVASTNRSTNIKDKNAEVKTIERHTRDHSFKLKTLILKILIVLLELHYVDHLWF